MHTRTALFTALSLSAAMAASEAAADVVISTEATQNISCSGGVCSPTATKAFLNVTDLEGLLDSGSVTVTTTGSGVQANTIRTRAPLTWSTSSTLALIAAKYVFISKAVSVNGTAELSLASGAKLGALSFGRKGKITFSNLTSELVINGIAFTLEGTVHSLASAIAANPSGNYALAASYDAENDGTYSSSPIPTPFSGVFEGLGNVISNVKISAAPQSRELGLFSELLGGTIEDIGMTHLRVAMTANSQSLTSVGSLVGLDSGGDIRNSYVKGAVSASATVNQELAVGGLIGQINDANVENSSSDVRISLQNGDAGGLVAILEGGTITHSHALGSIKEKGGGTLIGGLVGGLGRWNCDRWIPDIRLNSPSVESNSCPVQGIVTKSYASGRVFGYDDPSCNQVGGLVGENQGTIHQSFATGEVFGCYAGGLVGSNDGGGHIRDSYATGAVTGKDGAAAVGGLIGATQGGGGVKISRNYSTGAVSGKKGTYVGGLVGEDYFQEITFGQTYWDTTTSGVTSLSQGAGNVANDPGISGLSTAEFQSELPKGFHNRVWAEDPAINNGFPYLINNPPPE